MNRRSSVLLSYPLAELCVALLCVAAVLMLPWRTASQRSSIALFVGLSVVVALVWHFAVSATPPGRRWVHAALGASIVAVGVCVHFTVQTAILSILSIPIGLGIVIAALCSALR
ncbi:hypothetical protein C3E79_00325 [Corynebacterium liangguodongii]|uniref:Uncharacterized protein n=1 Tax=Corynebacterium liangguodongii TaxID=2079535 RepID=A0A2S0WBI7_9CORY|nr:hypothetical protein C3E79_00325 [Corynebacterium liangguodongii]PWB99274.1 hypothetical protein DF219_06750 [Corynebacterium liangguodongii]